MVDLGELQRDKQRLRSELFDVQAKLNNNTYSAGEKEMFQRRERQIFEAMDEIDRQIYAASDGAAVTETDTHWDKARQWSHEQAKKGLKKAGQAAGYIGKGTVNSLRGSPNGNGFLVIAIIVHVLIYTSGALRTGSYGWLILSAIVLSLAHIALFRGYGSELNNAAMIAIWLPPIALLFLGFSSAILPDIADSDAVQQGFTILYPLIIWYMLLSGKYEIGSLFKWIGTIAAILLVLTYLSPQVPTLLERIDAPATGIDTGEAAGDVWQNFLQSLSNGINGIFCNFGSSGCGLAGWLNAQIEPFAYDATTVHTLQNKELGVYITDVESSDTLQTGGYSLSSVLPGGIEFKIKAPIPQDLQFEFCSATDSDLKGFENICSRDILLTCEVEDSAETRIEPFEVLSIQQAVASQGRSFICRFSPPVDVAGSRSSTRTTRDVTLKAEYPFATNTYKLIRAVSDDVAFSGEQIRELNEFSDKFIVSTGGPVIIETDESNYITISDDRENRESLLLRLTAEDDVRLVALDMVAIYVPEGTELVDNPETFCGVTLSECDVADEMCSYLSSYAPSFVSESSKACATDASCTPSAGDTYYLSADSLKAANTYLAVNDDTENDLEIGCQLRITNPDLFLYENQLVTERAVNVIATYRVEHEQSSRVTFEGQNPMISRSTYGYSETCQASNGYQIPVGISPVSTTADLVVTDPFGRGPERYHYGVDLDHNSASEV